MTSADGPGGGGGGIGDAAPLVAEVGGGGGGGGADAGVPSGASKPDVIASSWHGSGTGAGDTWRPHGS